MKKLETIINFNKKNVYCGKSKKGYGFTYFAKKNIKPGKIVMMGMGKRIDHQTPHISVQIKKNEHYIPLKWTGRYWNHSCDPNTFVKTRSDGFPNLISKREIKKDEEINYSYFMTEFEWINEADEKSVKCGCKNLKCIGKIRSFSELSKKEQKALLKSKKCSKYLFTV